MRDIKLVVTDLDGTLLAPDKSIPQDAVDAVAALAKRDILFTFVTGRPHIAVERFARRLMITAPMLTCNGAIIFDGEKVLSRHSFALERLKNLACEAASNGFTVLIYQGDIEYSLSETAWAIERQKAGRAIPLRKPYEIKWTTESADKLNIMTEKDSREFDTLLGLIDEVKDAYSVTIYDNSGCEIVAKGINKAAGLHELCKLLNLEVKNVLAVGDNANDNEMLMKSGVGAAVANAAPSTKLYADYLCKASFTEGVIEAIYTIALNQ